MCVFFFAALFLLLFSWRSGLLLSSCELWEFLCGAHHNGTPLHQYIIHIVQVHNILVQWGSEIVLELLRHKFVCACVCVDTKKTREHRMVHRVWVFTAWYILLCRSVGVVWFSCISVYIGYAAWFFDLLHSCSFRVTRHTRHHINTVHAHNDIIKKTATIYNWIFGDRFSAKCLLPKGAWAASWFVYVVHCAPCVYGSIRGNVFGARRLVGVVVVGALWSPSVASGRRWCGENETFFVHRRHTRVHGTNTHSGNAANRQTRHEKKLQEDCGPNFVKVEEYRRVFILLSRSTRNTTDGRNVWDETDERRRSGAFCSVWRRRRAAVVELFAAPRMQQPTATVGRRVGASLWGSASASALLVFLSFSRCQWRGRYIFKCFFTFDLKVNPFRCSVLYWIFYIL